EISSAQIRAKRYRTSSLDSLSRKAVEKCVESVAFSDPMSEEHRMDSEEADNGSVIVMSVAIGLGCVLLSSIWLIIRLLPIGFIPIIYLNRKYIFEKNSWLRSPRAAEDNAAGVENRGPAISFSQSEDIQFHRHPSPVRKTGWRTSLQEPAQLSRNWKCATFLIDFLKTSCRG
ncbi:hypothetical protein GCK32_008836, partial [Trichostrongylus colubriformis]